MDRFKNILVKIWSNNDGFASITTFLALSIVTLIFRMAVPGMIYLFLPCIGILILLLFIKQKFIFSFIFFKNLGVFIGVLFFVLFGLIQSSTPHFLVIKEIINSIIVFILILTLSEINDLKKIEKVFLELFSFGSYIISFGALLLLFSNYRFLEGISISMVSDYNFYSLCCILAIISTIYQLSKKERQITIHNFGLFILSLNIILSSSRRGIIAFFILFLIILSYSAFNKWLFKKLSIYFTLLLFIIVGALSFYFSSIETKNQLLNINKGGSYNFKLMYVSLLDKYNSIFSSDKSYYGIYENQFGYSEYNANYPETWCKRKFIFEKDVDGKNSNIVPQGAYAARFQRNVILKEKNDNAHFFYVIGTDSIYNSSGFVKTSIFCKVSKNFNGDMVRLRVKGAKIVNLDSYYDLNRKGEWQELFIFGRCYEGEVSALIEFTQSQNFDFSDLKGNVDFSYPEFKVYNNPNFFPEYYSSNPKCWAKGNFDKTTIPDSLVLLFPEETYGAKFDNTSKSSSWSGDAYFFNLIGNDSVKKGDSIFSSVYCYVSKDFNGEWVRLSSEGVTSYEKAFYNLNQRGSWQQLTIKSKCSEKGIAPVYLYFFEKGNINFSNLKGYVIFLFPQYEKKANVSNVLSMNIINKNNQSNEIDEVNYEIPLKLSYYDKMLTIPSLSINYNSDRLKGERIYRWLYAFELWKNSYNTRQKLFGHGFDYLQWYGEKFYKEPLRLDYPHNPLISSFLYSGIIGGFWYLFFLVKSFILYWKKREVLQVFFIMYIFTFTFCFFSGNSHLSVPLFVFLSLIPFIIKNQEISKC